MKRSRARWLSLPVAGGLAAGGVGVAPATPSVLWMAPILHQYPDQIIVPCNVGPAGGYGVAMGCQVDTGSEAPLVMGASLARALDIQPTAATGLQVSGIGGQADAGTAAVDVDILGHTERVTAYVLPGWTGNLLIGLPLLQEFGPSVTLDFADRAMTVDTPAAAA